jgi:protein TonB
MGDTTRKRGWLILALFVSVTVHILVFGALNGIRPLEVGPRSVLAMTVRNIVEQAQEAKKATPIDVSPPKIITHLKPKHVEAAMPAPAPEAPKEAPQPDTQPSSGEPAPDPAIGTTEPEHGTGPSVGTGEMRSGSAPNPMAEAIEALHSAPAGAGSGGSGGSPGIGDLRGYQRGIYTAVNAGRRYPPDARRLGLEGRAVLSVRIDRHGRLVRKPVIVESTKHAALDEEALRMVEAAAPFPPLPESYDKADADFMIPIKFKLND